MAKTDILELHIDLKAPDDVISGLLGVYALQRLRLPQGGVYPIPNRLGCWYILAVQSGTVWMAAQDRSRTLEYPQAAAVPGWAEVSLLSRRDCELTLVAAGGAAADQLLQESAAHGGLFFPMGGEHVHAVYRTLSAQTAGAASPAMASGVVYQMLTQLYRTGSEEAPHTHIPRVVGDAMALMQRDFAFLDGVGDLAGRLELSQEYLTRTFRKYVGVTPGRYLNRLRVEYAKLLLRQPGNTVAFVSDACGFSNGNYFARVFRQFTGMNPSAYVQETEGAACLPDGTPNSFYVL